MLLAFAALTAATVHLGASRLIRVPPNYSQLEPGLWLGGYVDEPPPGTQSVLNLCESDDRYRVDRYRWEPIADALPKPTLDWLRSQVAFIAAERAAGRVVYIHCRNGVSRSGMVAVAYFMDRNRWSRAQAMAFVRERRPELRPNPAFMQLLLEFEEAQQRSSD